MIKKYIFPDGKSHFLIKDEKPMVFRNMVEDSVSLINTPKTIITDSEIGHLKVDKSEYTMVIDNIVGSMDISSSYCMIVGNIAI